MKKLNKLLSLLLVLVLLVPMLNVSSAEGVDPALQYPLLTGPEYFNIDNSGITPGGVKDTIDFQTYFDDNGNEVNKAATFSVVSTGNYTAGQVILENYQNSSGSRFFRPSYR